MLNKPIRLIELFAGIGSQAKALKNLGIDFEHHFICEWDKYAVQSYNVIHATSFIPLDITKISGKDLNVVETDKYNYILTYSFPCQDLSVAGKKTGMSKESSTRSGLLWQVERLLMELDNLPQVLLMENVTDVHKRNNIDDFNKWLEFLESIGYNNYWRDLNSKDFGIPQSRDRCFVVSLLSNCKYVFPKPIKLKTKLQDVLENNNLVENSCFYSDDRLKQFVNYIDIINGNLKNKYYSLKDVDERFIPASAKGRKQDSGWYLQAVELRENSLIMGTLCTVPKYALIFDKKYNTLRWLNSLECWRLMGFDDVDYIKAKNTGLSESRLKMQAGNSIVVPVLQFIFAKMLDRRSRGMGAFIDAIKKESQKGRWKIQDHETQKIDDIFNSLILCPPVQKAEIEFEKNIFTRGTGEEERVGLHLSSVIVPDSKYCLRAQVLSLLYKPKNMDKAFGNDLLRIFEEGNYIHRKWQRFFLRGSICTVKDLDCTVSSYRYNLSYSPDAIITIDNVRYVVEIKSMRTELYNKSDKHPSAEKQIRMYMYLLDIKNGIILMENKNDQTYKLQLVEHDEEKVKPYIARLEQIKDHYEGKNMPGRHPECTTELSKKCTDCNMSHVCWGSKEYKRGQLIGEKGGQFKK